MDDKIDNTDGNSGSEHEISFILKEDSKTSVVWKYFTKLEPSAGKIAKCNICQEVKSYKSTVTNLKMHIFLMHAELLVKEPGLRRGIRRYKKNDITLDEKQVRELKNNEEYEKSGNSKEKKKNRSVIWRYFRKLKPDKARKAQCKVCENNFSYKTTISNLKTHVAIKHPEICRDDPYFGGKTYYMRDRAEKSRRNRNERASADECKLWEYMEDDDDDDADHSHNDDTVKLTSQIWAQFNHDDEEPTCNLCRELVSSRLEDMKNHLEERHPDVLDHITAAAMEAESDGDENIFTEVVYLEEEPTTNEKTPSNKQKYKQEPHSSEKKKLKSEKRERNVSESSDDEPVIKIKKDKKTEPQNELDTFLSYLKVLLQKVPEENSSKLHLDIINLVMNATKPPQKTVEKNAQTNNINKSIILAYDDTIHGNNVNNCQNQIVAATNSNTNEKAATSVISVPIQKLIDENIIPRVVKMPATTVSTSKH